MTTNNPSLAVDESLESLVGRVVDEFLERQSEGRRPEIQEYLDRYPHAADLLRNVLASLQLIEDSQWAAGGGAGENDACPEELGDFRIVREVGRGGMGVVYEAEQISLGRRVALKILPLAGVLDSRRLQRFKNESRAAAALHHAAIAPVYSTGCERGVHYYAMQFIDGATLAELIAALRSGGTKTPGDSSPEGDDSQAPTLPHGNRPESNRSHDKSLANRPTRPRAAADESTLRALAATPAGRPHYRAVAGLAAVAAEALDYAHQQGVVHRDIKPANLMLDKDGRLWVTDFGLAHIEADVGVTLTGDVLGTLRYMSPEQLLARRGVVDGRSDVYSLGATLYELLTLQPAFPGDERADLLERIASEEPTALRAIDSRIPVDLETVVLKALAKNPAERYATAADMADDLRRFLDDRPILARPPTLAQRASRWVRRHRAISAALGAVAATLLVTAAAALVLYARSAASAAARQAETNSRIAQLLATAVQAQEQSGSAADQQLSREQARDAVREAATLSQLPSADRQLANRARELLAKMDDEANDRELLARLEEAWLKATLVDNRTGQFQFARSASDAKKAFEQWGLKPESAIETAAKKIEARPPQVQAEIAAGIDRWIRAISAKGELSAADKRLGIWLSKLYQRIDADPWRAQLRKALIAKDHQALLKLAQAAELRDQPVFIAQTLGDALCEKPETSKAGIGVLESAAQRTPDDFWIHYRLIVFHLQGRPPRAEEALRHASIAVALRPNVAAAHVLQGIAFRGAGRIPEAIEAYRRAIELAPDYTDAYGNLGGALTDLDDMAGAEAAFRKAIAIEPYAEAHYNLGNTLARQGRVEEAIPEYRKAIEFRPKYANAWCKLGYLASEKRQFVESLEYYRKAVAADPANSEATTGLAIALSELGQFDLALHGYIKALALAPDAPFTNLNLVEAYQDVGRYQEALQTLEKFLGKAADMPLALREHASLLGTLGRLDEAADAYRKLGELTPEDPQVVCELGDVLITQGKFDEALAAFQRGHELGQKSPNWKQPSAEWVEHCQQLLHRRQQLVETLPESAFPADPAEAVELAEVARALGRWPDAVRLYEHVERHTPAQFQDASTRLRYQAACAAAAAGNAGVSQALAQPESEPASAESERARHRQLALRWLQDDLAWWADERHHSTDGADFSAIKALELWRGDQRLRWVRQSEELARLPAIEQQRWQVFWSDVERTIGELRQAAAGKQARKAADLGLSGEL